MAGVDNRSCRLVLAGAGHAHVEILRRFIRSPLAGVDLTLVSMSRRHHYSGMVPGFLNGSYSEEELAFDLPQLAGRAGARFLEAGISGLSPARRCLEIEGSDPVAYDLVSLNTGSGSAGVVSKHAVVIKPMSRAVELRRRLGRAVGSAVVVGGGAAGFEVACAIRSVGARVAIVEASPEILSEYTARFRARAIEVLQAKRIEIATGQPAAEVTPDRVGLADGRHLDSDLTVWLAGPASAPFYRESGLSVDERGFLLVDDSLRSVDDERVFAVGDCASLINYPGTPKAGVYAVRQGPVLWECLKAAVEGRRPPTYTPQSGFLSILNTSDGRSLLRYKSMVSYSRWAWWLKDRIDRSFMRRYQSLVK